ncbi:MAG TPA: hypothetical protein VFS76_19485 [Pyrinomonadaceae bacterium]|nr:hypothetical protein [Pyrinomonadaceae bacterium]
MSWQRIVLPFTVDINPDMVEIGKRAWECYRNEKQPEGFAMFHATRGPGSGDEHDQFIVYFSPIAAQACSAAVTGDYMMEPCEVPYYNEPNIAFVFGDPRVMNDLRTQL